jgi:hypothetical protein
MMSNLTDIAKENVSLANGGKLNQESFDEFVTRLKLHSRGEGVKDHCTADALFVVQALRRVIGIDREYTDNLVAFDSDSEAEYFSPEEYYESLDSDEKTALGAASQEANESAFMDSLEFEQWNLLDGYNDMQVSGYHEYWEYVNSHFTKEGAEAFIKRKKHDYRKGLRIYVEANIYCWEFNAIKEALMDGKLVYKP